jgi:hypothetical protein
MKKVLGRQLMRVVMAGTLVVLAGCSGSSYGGNNNGGNGYGGSTATGGTAGSDTGGACHAPGTLAVVNSGMTAYLIDQVANPDLPLCRGATYVFAVNAPGHPFYINSVRGTGTANAYNDGVTGNGATNGNVTFVVPATAPETLYYNCAIHPAMTGTIRIVD